MANLYCNSIAQCAIFTMILCSFCSESFVPTCSFKPRSTRRETTTRSSASEDDLHNQDEKSSKDEYSLSDAEMKWIESRASSSSPSKNINLEASFQNEKRQEYDEDEWAGNVNIPKTGISVSDEMIDLQSKESFVTRLISLEDEDNFIGTRCVPEGVMAAKIETTVRDQIGEEPARYLVPLSTSLISTDENNDVTESTSGGRTGASNNVVKYAMVDVPPYSEELASQIRSFMTSPFSKDDERQKKKERQSGILSNILITSLDGIHYDEAPAVYVSRKSDLLLWKKAFPEAHIVIYRLDAPQECKNLVSQVLDGYGPWVLEEAVQGELSDESLNSDDATKQKEEKNTSVKFVETGRPLTRVEWNETMAEQVLDQGMAPPDDESDDSDELYTPEAIRLREEGKDIIAIYTPGHTFGSVTYIFPKAKVCCSGYTIPLEDTRPDAGAGSIPGPTMDYRGYITTNQGGMTRQIESARHVVNFYGDRFEAILPSRGSPVWLSSDSTDNDKNVKYRARIWNQILNDYAELGRVYERLGII